jgi:nicotinate-nucleotide pyrophosphorylase (carboxylating)
LDIPDAVICCGNAFKVQLMDLRDKILKSALHQTVTAIIIADEDGILSGTTAARKEAEQLGLSVVNMMSDGDAVKAGDEIARVEGSPKQVVMAEETLMGLLAKTSGIATAARRFKQSVDERPRVVCGAWKKMPPPLKHAVRSAVTHGGAAFRISDEPFVYLDKNYVRILGGIRRCLEATQDLKEHIRVVQLKGEEKDIVSEALEALEYGARILFIDTGRLGDVRAVLNRLHETGQRHGVKIAFGNNVGLDDMTALRALDIDIVDIGRAIVDAPLLDMRMEVL